MFENLLLPSMYRFEKKIAEEIAKKVVKKMVGDWRPVRCSLNFDF
jgi:hypothetical protein